ncbi:MAG: restriction endonuclease subunit S [Lachnospiraceae bacterium]|nr:restriction endonuclease subunit S [Lachnospiraceae bacterium]
MKVKIGDVCTLKSGTSLKENVLNDTDGIPYIKVSDMNLIGNEKYIITANSYADESISTKMLFPKGTILFPKRGGAIGTNKKRIANRVVCADLNTMGVIPSEKIRPLFLYYYFQNIDFGTLYNGSSVPQINNTDIAPMEIELLSLDEQDEAIAVLEKIDSIIRKRKTELKKLDDLIKTRFVELFGDTILNPFGWEKDSLGTVCDVRDGTHDSPKYHETGYPLVTSKNVTGGKIDLTDCSLICEEDFNKINERSKVDIGDIIMPMIGTVGKPVIVDIEPNFAIKNVALIKFEADSRVLNVYVRALLQSDYFDDAVLSKVRGGTQKFISLGDIRKLGVLVPPMELQKQFGAFIEQTDKSKFIVQKSLEETQKLFDSLMQKYFG